ncbi:hypothetical protein [Clostridium chrysemydis]|uniref:hypothetical protein n=1 Tax=Clostridium chrysemydis TaxID=2665504 RepID=UPI001883E668|nr:hypothetical protein [Clostridium chrysemydis]
MESKVEFIKETTNFLTTSSTLYLINISSCKETEHILKIIFKLLSKEYVNKNINITILSDDITNFNIAFPNIKNNIKENTKYSVLNNSLSFNILKKDLFKNKPAFENDILIVFPYDSIKPKLIGKYIKNSSHLNKIIIIGTNLTENSLPNFLRIGSSMYFSFVKSHISSYYKYYNSRLSDMK